MSAPAKSTPRPAPRKGGTASKNSGGTVAKKSVGKAENATTPEESGPRYTRKAYPAPKEGFKLYEAGPGGAGYINVRQHDKVMQFAADISDPDAKFEGARNPNWVKGLISRFFANEEAAQKYKAQKEEEGYKVRIVEARPYSGAVENS